LRFSQLGCLGNEAVRRASAPVLAMPLVTLFSLATLPFSMICGTGVRPCLQQWLNLKSLCFPRLNGFVSAIL
jgi:hypothetical protein